MTIEIIIRLATAQQNIKSTVDDIKNKAARELRELLYASQVSCTFKRGALETLLQEVPYDQLREDISELIQTTNDPDFKDELLNAQNRHGDRIITELEQYRKLWKNNASLGAEGLQRIIADHNTNTQDRLTAVYTLITSCYSPDHKAALTSSISTIYTFLTTLNKAHTRDILRTLFAFRDQTISGENQRVFIETVDNMSSINVYAAWDFIVEALECSRETAFRGICDYILSWLDTPPFNLTTTVKIKCIHQFYVSEWLLRDGPVDYHHQVCIFLLDIAESDAYSTFIRGDALDVLLRAKIPSEYTTRLHEIREHLRGVRENSVRNMRLYAYERGVEYREPIFTDKAIAGTTFDDSQNVHATTINSAITTSLLNMSNDQEIRGNTIDKVIADISKMIKTSNLEKQKIANAIEALQRYKTDPAVFTEKRITLGATLVYVWNRIVTHTDREALQFRLIDELVDACGTCATGHLSRAISVLIGYYSDIKQALDYSTQLIDNIKARIYFLVKQSPQDIRDDLTVALMGPDCEEYEMLCKYLSDHTESVRKELYAEFVPQYIQADKFSNIFITHWPAS